MVSVAGADEFVVEHDLPHEGDVQIQWDGCGGCAKVELVKQTSVVVLE